ncbi:MAG TPA: hypothetical protein VGO03_01610 [Acidimicrobiia bacterium]
MAIDAAERAIDEQRAYVAAQRGEPRGEAPDATAERSDDASPGSAHRRVRRIDIA